MPYKSSEEPSNLPCWPHGCTKTSALTPWDPLEIPLGPFWPPRPSQITKRPKTFAQLTLGLVSKQLSTSPHGPGPIWSSWRLPPASGCGSSPSWALARVPMWLTTSQAKCIKEGFLYSHQFLQDLQDPEWDGTTFKQRFVGRSQQLHQHTSRQVI